MNILKTIRAVIDPRITASDQPELAAHATDLASRAHMLTEQIILDLSMVTDTIEQFRLEDYDLGSLLAEIIRPIANYLSDGDWPIRRQFVKPIFVSGAPGIGKTSLLMLLDEVLTHQTRSDSASCRNLVGSGAVRGYFADKTMLTVTPLRLFGRQTAVLSARDWNNVLRHWTFDEAQATQSVTALTDFTAQLRGKVVFVDEAEIEGYVFFTETLASAGILVILSSNLNREHIHLAPDRVRAIELEGRDHRAGDLAKVCLPNRPHVWFDSFTGAAVATHILDGTRFVYLNWLELQDAPLMKDDFAAMFRSKKAEFILLDAVPFFAPVDSADVGLTFLGRLSRFVNFVDAIHDCGLPLLIRGTHPDPLNGADDGSAFKAFLDAYDARVGDHLGRLAWIEWTRCLSRLKSRDPINRLNDGRPDVAAHSF